MLKLLRHLLCIGILFGLAGNGVAVAAPCLLMNQEQAAPSAAMPDCKMATSCADCASKPGKTDKTDKGAKPGCMAMAACSAVLGVKEPSGPATVSLPSIAGVFWSTQVILTGHDTGPELEPPTFLA